MIENKVDNNQIVQYRYHIAIGLMFLLISVGTFYLHAEDNLLQYILMELYYIPIITASVAFSWRWGLIYGILSGVILVIDQYRLPIEPWIWYPNLTINVFIRVILFLVVGFVPGYISYREKQRADGYRRLTKTIQEIHSSNRKYDVSGWMDEILNAAEHILRPKSTNSISIMFLNESDNTLYIIAARGLSDEIIRTTRQPVGKGIAGYVIQSGKPLLCQDFGKFSDIIEMTESERGITSSICIPLISKNKSIGVMCATTHSWTQQYDEMDLAPFVILGHAVALTLENTELNKGLKTAYLQTVHALAQTIDVKDKSTCHHSEQMAKLALKLGDCFELSDQEKEDLYAASLLHDIGKIGIRDSILLKNSKLTTEEYEEIKKHSALGLKILEPLENMRGVAKLVYHHQEKYDGSGYPQGLKGDDIPLGSRIIAVVDAYHAMISERIYQKAISPKDALRELERNKGTQFDSGIVDKFIEIIKKENYILNLEGNMS